MYLHTTCHHSNAYNISFQSQLYISILMYTYGTGFQFHLHISSSMYRRHVSRPIHTIVFSILSSISMSLSLFCSCLSFTCSHYQIIVVAIPPGQSFDVTANPADLYGPDFDYSSYSAVSVLRPAVSVHVCLVYFIMYLTSIANILLCLLLIYNHSLYCYYC